VLDRRPFASHHRGSGSDFVKVLEDLLGTIDLPCSASSAGHARRWTEGVVRDPRFAAIRDDAILLVSELVTNAVLHARTGVRISVWSGVGVRFEVTDYTASAPRRRLADRLSTTGRGLGLLDARAVDWGVEVDDEATTVWFVLDPKRPIDEVRAARWFAHDWFGGIGE
jgi:anti-sigma regulatory factor (Ser/Thr protein kinase)